MTAHWVPWTISDELAAVAAENGPHVLYPRTPPVKKRICPICRKYVTDLGPRIVVAKRLHHMRCFEAFTDALKAANKSLTEAEYEIVLDREGR